MKDTQIKKVHRLLDLLFSMGILALGLFFIFVIPSWNWLGISLLITAAFMLPFYKTGYVIKNQEGVFLKKEILLLELYYKKDHSKTMWPGLLSE